MSLQTEESSAVRHDNDRIEHAADDEVLLGCLAMVDLAGSERLTRSEVAGDRLRETKVRWVTHTDREYVHIY